MEWEIEQENHIKNILIHNLKTLPYPNTMEFEKMSDMELSTVIDIVAYIVDDYKNMDELLEADKNNRIKRMKGK